MPESCYSKDREWINQQLGYLNNIERQRVCVAYSLVFNEAFTVEEREQRKLNRARYEANTRLRIYIEKKLAVFNK